MPPYPVATLRKEGSRERILAGATDEFAAAGFAGARIDRIARRTRLNVRMIYYHFGSKKGLYRAVLEGIYERAAQIIEVSWRSSDPALVGLGLYLDLLVANPQFASVLVREILDGARHLNELFTERPELFYRVHQHAREMLQAGMASGAVGPLDPPLAVATLTSTVCFLSATRQTLPVFLDGQVPSADTWKAHLVALLFEGLRPRP